jgi:putative transposase
MSFTKIFIHAVWSTHVRLPFLVPEIRKKVFDHMKQNARQKNIHVLELNGYVDHVHCLISLDRDMTLSKAVQLLKGESSYWINKSGLTKAKFEWQGEYYGASVSHSDLGSVIGYIRNQEEHHKQQTFDQEYSEMIKDMIVE